MEGETLISSYFLYLFRPHPASPIKQLPRRINVPGWKAYAMIIAPVSMDPTEGDGIKK